MMNGPDLEARITELWDELPNVVGTARAGLLLELADRLMEAERHAEALPVLETAQELLADEGSTHTWLAGRAAHNRAVVLGHLDRPDEQLEAEREAIALYVAGDRPDLAGCCRMALGFHLRNRGRVKDALTEFRAAETDFVGSDEAPHRANALMAMLEAEVDLGRFSAAGRLLKPALHAVSAASPIATVARLHELAASVFEVRATPELVRKALRNARAIWNALDEATHVARCDIRSAVLASATDGPEAAAALLHDLRPARQAAGDVAGVAACDRGLGTIALLRDRPHQALRRLEDAAAVFQACALFADAAECEALAGQALAELSRRDEALGLLRRVTPVLQRLLRPRAECDARLTLARLLLETGDTADARRARREACRAESLARRGPLLPQLHEARAVRLHAEAATGMPTRRVPSGSRAGHGDT